MVARRADVNAFEVEAITNWVSGVISSPSGL
jgi:hypothetical protein